ncbi:hypothetical protein [Desulfoluna spongiiphila]|uniref:Phage tail tape measure protein, TP901 family, core region n=1 Tax=Desulfoluna spongiiphila TaxID=419481 RepID=A0A1G5ACY7_9BACT|nr:hypothetical protein [Desulfoluna spongiiphila]SCX75723.1 hypothetical protein SAMN05216233_10159 [Desulfoluna spongiiphila]
MASTNTLILPTDTSAAQAMVAAGEAVIDQISRVGQSLKGFSLGLSAVKAPTDNIKRTTPGDALATAPEPPKNNMGDALGSLASIISKLGKAVAPLQETGELAKEAWDEAKSGLGSAYKAFKGLKGQKETTEKSSEADVPSTPGKKKRQKKPGKKGKKKRRPEKAKTESKSDTETTPGSVFQRFETTASSFETALGSLQGIDTSAITLPASLEPLTTVVADFGEGLGSIQEKAATAQDAWNSAKEGIDATKNAWASLKQGFKGKGKAKKNDAADKENTPEQPGTVFQGIGTAATSFQSALGTLRGLDTGNVTLPASLAPLTTLVTDFGEGLGTLKEKAATAQEAWDSAKEGVDAAKNVWAGLKQGLGGSKKGNKNTSGKAKDTSKKAPGDLFQNAKKATAAFETTLGRIGQVAHMDLGLPAQFAPLQSMLSNVGNGIDAVQEKAETAKAIWGNTKQGLDMVKTGLTTMSGMGGPIGGVATKLLSMGSGVKALGGTFMSFAGRVIPMMAGGIRALSAAFMTNPIGLAIAGIALAAVLIIKCWKPLGAFFKGLWGGIVGMAKGVLGWLMPTFKVIGAVWKTFSGLFSKKKKPDDEEPKDKKLGKTQKKEKKKKKKNSKGTAKTKPGNALAKNKKGNSKAKGARTGNPTKLGSTATKPVKNQSFTPSPAKPKKNRGADTSGQPAKAGKNKSRQTQQGAPSGGSPINIYVYGAEGQSTRELAEEVLRHLKREQTRRFYD